MIVPKSPRPAVLPRHRMLIQYYVATGKPRPGFPRPPARAGGLGNTHTIEQWYQLSGQWDILLFGDDPAEIGQLAAQVVAMGQLLLSRLGQIG